MRNGNISCDVCRELLSARSDGEDVTSESAALTHLETCAACRGFQSDLGRIRSALNAWPDELPRDEVRVITRSVPRPAPFMFRLAAAAACVVAIVAAFVAGRATAPGAAQDGGSTGVAPTATHPIEHERYVVPARNEIYSTITLSAVRNTGGDNPPRRSR
jgi:predicted anti-sigma-YlaC factor YlaD